MLSFAVFQEVAGEVELTLNPLKNAVLDFGVKVLPGRGRDPLNHGTGWCSGYQTYEHQAGTQKTGKKGASGSFQRILPINIGSVF